MRNPVNLSGLPFVLVTDAETGVACAVNGLQIETIDDTRDGAEITFASGATVTVREPFDSIVATFRNGRRRSRRHAAKRR